MHSIPQNVRVIIHYIYDAKELFFRYDAKIKAFIIYSDNVIKICLNCKIEITPVKRKLVHSLTGI